MKELQTLIDMSQLSGTGSATEKQKLLANCKTNTMQWLLQIATNPFKTTKISKLSIPTSLSTSDDAFDKIQEKINYLLTVKAAKDEDRHFLEKQVSCLSCSDEQKEMLVKILTKNLNIGVGVSIINKVFGKNFIPDLELMAAQDDMTQIDTSKVNYAEIKYDGVRVIAVEEKEGVTFYTRNFNILNSDLMPSIEKEAAEFIKKFKEQNNISHQVFIDGELTDFNRKSVTGKVNQILKGKAKSALDSDLLFNIFDVGDFSWIEKDITGNVPYTKRREQIVSTFTDTSFKHLLQAEMHVVSSKTEINDLFNKVVAKGGEGLIIKTAEHLYECKRSKHWIKLKEVNDCDLKIIGYFEGENKRKENGWIGGFICQSEDTTLNVNVGSGFTEDMLIHFSKDPESWVGKVAKVQYNTKIQDKHDAWSLFLPVFLEIRFDKTTANSLKEIK